ncbi:MAG: hypothetical protein LBI89_02840 [Prevotellaceae bacterium]|jgi:hypothetical protein|nr:hypothetical protein [Prevotellaceae bacterium]
MRIAIFLGCLNFEAFQHVSISEVLLFDVHDRLIKAIGIDKLLLTNVEYLLLWLMTHRVEQVYLNHSEPQLIRHMEVAGLTVKSLDEIRNNPVYQAFLITHS